MARGVGSAPRAGRQRKGWEPLAAEGVKEAVADRLPSRPRRVSLVACLVERASLARPLLANFRRFLRKHIERISEAANTQ